jgi:hypothetical protein
LRSSLYLGLLHIFNTRRVGAQGVGFLIWEPAKKHGTGAASEQSDKTREAVCGFSKAMRKYGHEKTVNDSGNDFDVERFSGGER